LNPSIQPMFYTLFGATITGNRGAESMLRAAVQTISELDKHAGFCLLSLYPNEDMQENPFSNMRILPCKPISLVLLEFPMALISNILLKILPPKLVPMTRCGRTIYKSRVFIDLSGISFVDGRGYGILLYNCLTIIIPHLLHTKIVKYSQAMGSFELPINRMLAKWLLPKVSAILARGHQTMTYLENLGIPQDKLHSAMDSAFAMLVNMENSQSALDKIPILKDGNQSIICVSPSSVVEEYCRANRRDYSGIIAKFIDHITYNGIHKVLIIAHSARPGKASTKNNDLMVCHSIHQKVENKDACFFYDLSLNAEELRAAIGHCRMLVASRFHAMISALAMCVPMMMIGWSHKYAEVLDEFQLTNCFIPHKEIDLDRILQMFNSILEREESVKNVMRQCHDRAVHSSRRNAEIALEVSGSDVS
jgi:colanic acid/amylovoran biosynthesis protein